jgi:hypothetical protein
MRFVCLSLLAFLLPAANLRADDAADARAIVARAMKAAGIPNDGKPVALTMKFKEKPTGSGLETASTGDMVFQAPDKYRFTCKSQVGPIKIERRGVRRRPIDLGGMTIDALGVVNGNKAWESVLGVSREVTGEKLEQTLAEVYSIHVSSLVPLLTEKEFRLSTAGEREVNGKKTAAVKVEREQKPAITLFFDKETGLLAKVERKAKDELQGWKEVLSELYFDDYKDIGGRKYYTTMRNAQDGKPVMEVILFDQKFEEKLDPKLFEAIK